MEGEASLARTRRAGYLGRTYSVGVTFSVSTFLLALLGSCAEGPENQGRPCGMQVESTTRTFRGGIHHETLGHAA